MASEKAIKTILDLADVQAIQPDFEQVKVITRETCEKVQVIIFAKDKNKIKVLTTNNYTEPLKQILKMLEDRGLVYEVFYTSVEGFNHAMTWYDHVEAIEKDTESKAKAQRQASGLGALGMVKQLFDKKDSIEPGDFITEMVRLSFQTGASDLHFQPEDSGVVMRVRLDGILQKVVEFTHEDFIKYLQKLKFIAGVKMNIDYIPQDGRFSFEADKQGEMKKIDARVSFMPGLKTESTVIRFLDGTASAKTFEQIGFSGQSYDVLKRNIEKNVGMTIVTGPTGSGKTTTLYSILNYLNTGDRKIITLEDPVEYQVSGLQQSQINYTKGYTYELGLKAILRHDPDIVLVGETRTLETAEISITAALTGHLVFTTLHTNSAIESISRLLSMGVKPYMLAPSINMIMAQRLVRRLCPDCAGKREASYAEKVEVNDAIKRLVEANPKIVLKFDGKLPQAVGCDKCNHTGYRSRLALVETFEIDDAVRTMIIEGRSTIDIYAKARETGYLTMKEDGIIKLLEGKTTLDELRRTL